MYFGGFGMKSLTAWGNPTYQIPGNLTDGSGKGFLAALNTTQRAWVTSLLNAQRTNLTEIVTTRKAIATELRKLLTSGGSADLATVTSLSRRYGELDGEISYLYAAAFTKVGGTIAHGALKGVRPKGHWCMRCAIALRQPVIASTRYCSTIPLLLSPGCRAHALTLNL